jgi:hypothetical protein
MEENTSIKDASIPGIAGTGVIRFPNVDPLNRNIVVVQIPAQALKEIATDILRGGTGAFKRCKIIQILVVELF